MVCALLLGGLALPACVSIPAGDEETGGESTETGEPVDAVSPQTFQKPVKCDSSDECESGVCAAAFDASAGETAGDPVCVPSCIEQRVPTAFCIDDGSCCVGSVCDADGLCQPG